MKKALFIILLMLLTTVGLEAANRYSNVYVNVNNQTFLLPHKTVSDPVIATDWSTPTGSGTISICNIDNGVMEIRGVSVGTVTIKCTVRYANGYTDTTTFTITVNPSTGGGGGGGDGFEHN